MQIQGFLDLIERHTHKRPCKSGNGYQVCCPAHEDTNPSLSISENNGKILLHCHSGCSIDSICLSLGITIKDLFINQNLKQQRRTEYPYYDETGVLFYKKVRIEPGKDGKSKDFHFERLAANGRFEKNLNGVNRILYRLPELLKAKEEGKRIFLVEGEKDADKLQSYGLVATTAPEGAAGKWLEQYTRTLEGASVVLLFDEDVAGHQRRDKIIKELHQKVSSLRVVSLPGLEFTKNHGADVSDWLKMGHTTNELIQIVDQTPEYTLSNIVEEKREKKPSLIVPGGVHSIQDSAQLAGALLEKTGRFFLKGGRIVELTVEDNRDVSLTSLEAARFASDIEEVAYIVKPRGEELVPTTLNKSQSELIMEATAFRKQLNTIRVITKCPVLVKDEMGVRQVIGFDKNSGIFASGKRVNAMGIEDAIKTLLGLLEDFNFANDNDKARAIAAMITPALLFGDWINARSPLFAIEADQSQTGKGYLIKIIAALYGHIPKPITQRKDGLGGIEESLNKRLISGDSFISFDNMRGKIDSPALESLLTEDCYPARIPYMAPMDIETKKLVLFLTSNKGEMTQDLANRSCIIRIRRQPIDYDFHQYSEGDLLDHVKANQSLFLGAVFAVIESWHQKSCPQTDETRHDFRKWCRSLDWIVQYLFGLCPLMEGHRETQQRMALKQMNWVRSIGLHVIKTSLSNRWLRTSDILNVIEEADLEIPGFKESDDLADSETRKKVLTAMGREFGICFRASTQEENDIAEVTLDDIKIQRRTVKESRSGGSGSHEIKEYRFLSLGRHHAATKTPLAAPIATMPLMISIENQVKDVSDNNTKIVSTLNGVNGEQWRNGGGLMAR